MNDLQLKITLNGIDKTSRPLRNIKGGAKGLAQQIKETKEKLSQLNDLQKNLDGFAKLKQQVKDSRKAFNDARDKVKLLSEQFTNTSSSTKKMRRELEKAKKEANKLKDSFISLASKQRRQYTEFIRAGISTKNKINHQETLKSKIVATTQALEQQNLKWDKYNTHLKKLNNIRAKYDTGMQRVAILGGVGYGALSTGRTVARGMKNILGVGYQFDASMSATQAVTRIDDKNDPRMIALRKQARELPLVSKFTDSEVAQGQYFLGRTGYNPDQILKAMPGMLNLSAAGDVDLGTTADIASNIQMAMGLPAEKMDHVADVLTAMFTRNNVDIPMLGESLKYSAGVGASFGQSLETIATLTAVMGNAGIQGSQAGTTLRQILVRLGTSNAVAKLGVKVADKNGNMRDVIDIMSEISEATKHMGNVQRAQINKQIAGQIGLTGFEVLLTQASTGFLKKMRGEQGEYDGEAARVAKTKLDNLAGDMTMLHAAFENISVELFEKNNDWLRKAVQGLTNLLHGFGEFLKKHPAVSKALVVIGAGLATITTAFGAFAIMIMSIFGPMLMTRFILSRLGLSLGGFFTKTNIASGGLKALGRALLAIAGSPIKTFGAAFKGLGFIFTSVGRAFLLNPIGLAITAIIAVIVIAALVIRKYWEPIKAFFIGFWEGLKESLSPVVEEFSYLEPFVTTIGNGFKWLGEKISGLINWFCDLFEPVKLTKDELKKVENAGESFGKNFGKTLSGLIKIINLFTRVITYPANLIYKYWQPASDFFIGFWEGLSESLSNISDELSSFMPIIKTVGDIFNWIGNKISNLITWFDDLLKPIEKTKTEFKGAKEAGRAFGDSIGTVIKSLIWLFKKLQEIIVNTIKDLLSIPQKIGELAKKIEEMLTGEGDFFNKFTKIGSYIADGLIDGVNNKHGNIKVTMSNLADNIGNWFKSTLDIHSPSRLFAKFGGYTIDGYIHGIEHNQSDAFRSMSQLGKNIGNRFKNTLDIHSPSRLFAKFGGHTVDGYVNGIERNQNDAIQSVGQLANSIITTGSQLSSGVVVDNRHPIRGTGTSGISQYYITINAAPGMNEQQLARRVAKEIERRERNQSARYRSSLRDID